VTISREDFENLSPETRALLRDHGDANHIPITRDELRTMEPEEVARLHKNGELNHLLSPESGEAAAGVEAAADAEGEGQPRAGGSADQGARTKQTNRVGRESLRGLSPEEIVRRRRTGELDGLMRGER
jgi:hypothetical protein